MTGIVGCVHAMSATSELAAAHAPLDAALSVVEVVAASAFVSGALLRYQASALTPLDLLGLIALAGMEVTVVTGYGTPTALLGAEALIGFGLLRRWRASVAFAYAAVVTASLLITIAHHSVGALPPTGFAAAIVFAAAVVAHGYRPLGSVGARQNRRDPTAC